MATDRKMIGSDEASVTGWSPATGDVSSYMSPCLRSIVIFLIVALLAVLIYFPVVRQHFSDWDDERNISTVWKPSWDRAGKIAADLDLRLTGMAYYHPLFFLSLMADQVFALPDPQPAAWIAKTMNVVYHIINSYLVFLVLIATGVNRREAFLGTLIFAVHPVQVGTVAWVSERKNVLCLLFYLSSFLIFLRYLAGPRLVHLVLIPLLGLAALLTKPQAVTLPAVMIAWLLLVGRGSASRASLAAVVGSVMLGACAFGLFVLKTEVSYPGQMPSWVYRPLISAGTIWFYAKQFLFPHELVMIYPKWNVTGHVWVFTGLLAGMAVVAALIVGYRKRIDPLVLFGGSFAVINMLPVSGLVPFGYMSHSFVADHFMYFPMVGISLMAARGLEHAIEWLGDRRVYGTVLFMVLAVWISLLAVRAHRQVLLWGDPVAFWEETLRVNDKAVAVYIHYGRFCFNGGQYEKALSLFRKASAAAPAYEVPYNNMGDVYRAMGQTEKAVDMFRRAIEIKPDEIYPRLMIVGMLKQQNKLNEAIAYLRRCVAEFPKAGVFRNELGAALYQANRHEEALRELDEAVRLDPSVAAPYLSRGVILLGRGEAHESVASIRKAMALGAVKPETHNLLGAAYASVGDVSAALQEFRKAYSLNPSLEGARDNVANALLDLGNPKEAEQFCAEPASRGVPCSEATQKRIRDAAKGP